MIFHSFWFTLSAVLVSYFQMCLRVSSQFAFTAVSFRHKNNVFSLRFIAVLLLLFLSQKLRLKQVVLFFAFFTGFKLTSGFNPSLRPSLVQFYRGKLLGT